MLKITLDIFSGLPNPTWTLKGEEAQTVLREIQNTRGGVSELDSGTQPLGYRGFIIETEGTTRGLPSIFRVTSSSSLNETKAREILRKLRNNRSRGEIPTLPPPDANQPDNTIPESDPETVNPVSRSQSEGQCPFVATKYDPRPWNQLQVIRRNNCYNYATRRQTNTFAQPGRISGIDIGKPITARRVIRAALADGARSVQQCLSRSDAPLVMALVIAPDPEFNDFHWYRYHQEGVWGHKPGQTRARNVDNSGEVIKNPETCDRGSYTQFAGYFFVPRSMKVQ
ncbi:hypothetical protein Q2T42_19890 [Leptolyngbya boryana CZ1]|uniref:Uncharacterized protein n=1 Tax=Leptolyngbya boryana CZ1 TaxID=3060204 RepID=A0AA97ANJ0_LEPBY|nr:hypothetical protein [Leptolyngbya boryana]WNZ44094.1 hypothetical protein Q2T42_19890 [Leptolyngbya boryana CZ1]